MKRNIIIAVFAFFTSFAAFAQSRGMTDAQIVSFIQKEQQAGTPQAQIVTKLMQNGVDISQLQRIRKKLEATQRNASSIGASTDKITSVGQRVNNGELRDDMLETSDGQTVSLASHRVRGVQATSADITQMEEELELIEPTDSIALLKRLLKQEQQRRNRVFGRDIFNNKELSFEPNMNIATPKNYVLGAGDAVVIEIYGASQKTIEATVSPEGDVTIEGFGPIRVDGLTVEQANARLRSTVGSRYSSSKIRLSVGQTKTIMVNVMGEVKIPGTYTLSAFATVFHALYMAGGTNDLGTMRNIKVFRNNKLISTIDIYDYMLNGKLKGNVRLADNDVIVVDTYDCLVSISGKVKRPMIYEMRKDESLASILKYSGNFTGDAYTKSVRLFRKTGREYTIYNIGEFEFGSFNIADGDSIGVDSVLPRYKNTVEVKGAVFRPGMYNISQTVNSVRSLIEQADGITEQAFTARAVMHRMKTDRTLEVLAVDIEGIMSGRVPDVPLRENDVLFIPTKDVAIAEQTITIRGEVHAPGVYKYADNETIEDFVLQAGGLTDRASTVKVSVIRRVNDAKALRPDSVIANTFTLALKDGFVVDGTQGFVLMPFDEVSIFKSPGSVDVQTVSIEGQVMFEGIFGLRKRNSRLSDIVKEAGGTTDLAYVKGARLERRTNEVERKRMQAVYDMAREQQQKNLLQMASTSNNGASIAQIAEKNQQQQLDKFQVPDTYQVGINLEEALAKPGSDADIVLRHGDRIIVPSYNGTVKINGAVMYPNSVAYEKGKSARYYIEAAGGFASDAKKSKAYIIYMNGMVAKVSKGAKVSPGCEIVVPAKTLARTSTAEKLAMGSSMSSIAAMIATIANMVR